MRHVLLLALIAYRFDMPVPDAVLNSMRDEVSSILRNSGIETTWWDLKTAAGSPEAPEIVVVKFHGNCAMDTPVRGGQKAGALAVTHVSGNDVLPFADIDCDKVQASVWHTLLPIERAYGDPVLGRALGRVAAHELVHILTKSGTHGRRGVAQSAFSGHDLTTNEFVLAPEDEDRVRDSYR